MGAHTPLQYIQRRRALRHASKPTAIEKITARPFINPQIASPLFTVLPAEVRIQIFQFALLAYPNASKPYSQHTFWYRPDHTHSRAIATNLLRTCRRVYLETDLLPLILNEHIIWGVERSRIPPDAKNYLLRNQLKQSQRGAVQYVHIFTQQYWLEDWKDKWLAYSQSWPGGCPPRLRITIRHTDWWYNLLGENSPLALDPKRKGRARIGEWIGEEDAFESGSWGQRFANFRGLKEFSLELETIDRKQAELDAIVAIAPTWRFPLADANILVLDASATKKSEWTGSCHFKGNVSSGNASMPGSKKSSSSVTLRTNSEPEELAPDDSLHYYVVTLTWRAQSASIVEAERRAAKHAEEEAAREAARLKELNGVVGGALSATTNTATVGPPPPSTRVYYNRFNAPPTFYG